MSTGGQLLSMKDSFLAKTPTLGLKTTPSELNHYLKDIDRKLEDYQDVVNCLFTTKAPESGPIFKLMNKCESDILLSFCKPEIQIAPRFLNRPNSTKHIGNVRKVLLSRF